MQLSLIPARFLEVRRHFVAYFSIFSAVFARGRTAGVVHRLRQLERSLSAFFRYNRLAQLPDQISARGFPKRGLRSSQYHKVPDQVLNPYPRLVLCPVRRSQCPLQRREEEVLLLWQLLPLVGEMNPSLLKMIRDLDVRPGFAKVGRRLHASILSVVNASAFP